MKNFILVTVATVSLMAVSGCTATPSTIHGDTAATRSQQISGAFSG